jgi:serine/threonine-protein kinase
MLAGRLPFQAEGIGSLMGMHIYEQPPELQPLAPEVPADLAQLVKRMLTKDPAARPTALEAQQAVEQLFTRLGGRVTSISLTALRGDLGTESSPDGVRMGTLASANGQAAAAARRSRVVPIAVVATALCLLGGGAAVALWRGKKDVPAVEQPANNETARLPQDKEPQQVVTPPETGKKASATWSIETEPAGAQVVRVSDGKILGTTPWQGSQPEGDAPVAVRLRLAGYLDKVLTLKPGSDASYSQALRPQPGKKLRPPVGKIGPKNRQDGRKNEPEIAD